MDYMILIHSDETAVPERGSAQFERMMAGRMAYNQS